MILIFLLIANFIFANTNSNDVDDKVILSEELNLNLKENYNFEREIDNKWVKDLFRFFVIFIGSYPLTYFLTSLITDFSFYFYYGGNSNYLPFPFNPNLRTFEYFDERHIISFSVSSLLSLFVGIIDLVIGINEERKI